MVNITIAFQCHRQPVAERLRSVLATSLVGVVLLFAGCDFQLPGKPDPKDRPIPADKVLAFDALYGNNCAGCHGKDGKMGPAPPLNDPLFRAIVSLADLKKVVEEGRPNAILVAGGVRAENLNLLKKLNEGWPGTAMPTFGHAHGGTLTDVQIQVLIHEIKGVPYQIVKKLSAGQEEITVAANDKGIAPRWGTVHPAPSSAPPYALPTKGGSATKGAAVFRNACASCHGENGQGVLEGGQRLNKINDLAFLALISDQALRRIIITGRSDLKMPNYAQKDGRLDDFQPLTSSEIADLGALLSAWRQGKSVEEK